MPATVAGRDPAAPSAITAGAFAFSSSTTRCASFGPTPGAAFTALTSPSDSARATPSAPSVPRMASAARAPTPCTVTSSRHHSRSASVRKPISWIRSSRTTISA